MARTKSSIVRMLRPGELIPKGEFARRIDGQGYVRLMWYDGNDSYVEVYEHRIEDDPVIGRHVTFAHRVHRRNNDKQDNRPENLVFHYIKRRSRQKT